MKNNKSKFSSVHIPANIVLGTQVAVRQEIASIPHSEDVLHLFRFDQSDADTVDAIGRHVMSRERTGKIKMNKATSKNQKTGQVRRGVSVQEYVRVCVEFSRLSARVRRNILRTVEFRGKRTRKGNARQLASELGGFDVARVNGLRPVKTEKQSRMDTQYHPNSRTERRESDGMP